MRSTEEPSETGGMPMTSYPVPHIYSSDPNPGCRDHRFFNAKNEPVECPERIAFFMTDLRLSVVIASYNARDTIVPCLKILYAQTARNSFEVILIDSSTGVPGRL
jgi:hypothetical protein